MHHLARPFLLSKKNVLIPSRSLRYLPIFLLVIPACSSPSKANNTLRLDQQRLEQQIADLKRQHAGDEATIAELQNKVGTIPTLPQDRLEKLFTTHGIELGRLTGGDDFDPATPGDDGLRIGVVPMDQQGQKLKAAGSITVDAFDLSDPQDTHIGHWTFDLDQTKKNWFGNLLYTYVLRAPWQKIPRHPDLTVRVTFHDELTGREFTDQKLIKINPPPPSTTRPTTRAASRT